MKWLALGFGILFNALANVLMKAAARHGAGIGASGSLVGGAGGQPGGGGPAGLFATLLSAVLNVYLIAGIVSFVLALGAYTFALTRFELSVAYPMMTSLGLVLVAVASFVFFGEPFTWVKTVGTVLILFGVLLVARGGF
ncbi:MAG: SMR family transporter [Kyrpidia sp.]|nr:SMR family transporter [Kyrpidia sp.]